MAKSKPVDDYDDLLDVRKPTTRKPVEPEPQAAPAQAARPRRGRPRKKEYTPESVEPIGVGITHGEAEELKRIAESYNITRHEMLIWLVRDFMARHKRGEVKVPVEPVTMNRIKS